MESIFNIVYTFLKFLSELTGFSYKEINIISYYLILPFVYTILADKILGRHILKIAHLLIVLLTLLLIEDFSAFSEWLFDESVSFLLSFKLLGMNYVVSSVVICVILPFLVFVVMFHYAFPAVTRKIIDLLKRPASKK